jgi:LmbE family N-acetylglucosaminyl deacetylase
MSLKLLCICAHPDDECFAFGGALALASQRGIETAVLCLTDGTAGSYRGHASSDEELGQLRRAEFAASCSILGVTHHEILDYKDGQLEFTTLSDIGAELVERIRKLQPQVLITFGGDGAANTHPDHVVVSCATTAAFHWAGAAKRYTNLGPVYQPQRLFYLTTDYFLPDRPQPLPAPWTLTLDIRPVFETKLEAFAAHTTQLPLLERVRPLFQRYGQKELYSLAASPKPQPATQSTDMFEGVSD